MFYDGGGLTFSYLPIGYLEISSGNSLYLCRADISSTGLELIPPSFTIFNVDKL